MLMTNNSFFVNKDTVKDIGQDFARSRFVVESPRIFSDRQSKARHKTKREK